jgi:hypothetical protein
MGKALFLLTIFCIGSLGHSGSEHTVVAQSHARADKVKATKTVKGRFKGFQMGDYMHVVITKQNGKEDSFFLNQSEGLQYFLVAHKDKPLVFTYQVVETHIPEAGGMQAITRLVGARSGELTDKTWWRKQRAGSSLSKLRKKYEDMVAQATLYD